jgi:hypothetical protein
MLHFWAFFIENFVKHLSSPNLVVVCLIINSHSLCCLKMSSFHLNILKEVHDPQKVKCKENYITLHHIQIAKNLRLKESHRRLQEEKTHCVQKNNDKNDIIPHIRNTISLKTMKYHLNY